jgi:hypothetical protein
MGVKNKSLQHSVKSYFDTVTQKRASVEEKKPRSKRISGICAAAKACGVTRQHLWEVLKGRRKSKPLLARYTQRKQQAVIAVPIDLAAAENLSPFFFNTLATLGLEVLIVRFQAGHSSPVWHHPEIEKDLGQELQCAHAGQLDSEFYTNGARWFFYHVSDLAKAMQVLKAALEARGLLEITTLLHAETAQELRVWYPATAELVNAEADEEA